MSQGIQALLAVLPILLAAVLLVGFRCSAPVLRRTIIPTIYFLVVA